MTTQTRERSHRWGSSGNGRAPAKPTRLGLLSWFGVLTRTVTEFKADNLTDLAAALTYYGVLAIFPAIIALVSILGLIGHSATQPLVQNWTSSLRDRRSRYSRARSTVCRREPRRRRSGLYRRDRRRAVVGF